MKNIKGLIIQLRMEFLEERIGVDAIKGFLGLLSMPAQEILRSPVLPSSGYSFSILRELDEKLPQVIDMPLENLFREIGNYSAPKIVDRYFYNYVENRQPARFLEQFQRLYPILWGFGSVQVFPAEDEGGYYVQFFYEQDIHKPYCWFMQNVLTRSISIVGGESVVLNEKECDAENGEKCWYHIRWKEG